MSRDRQEVERLQLALMAMGYALPRFGADGFWGGETEAALSRYAHDHSFEAPDEADEWSDLCADVLSVYRRVEALGPMPAVDCRPYAHAEDVAGRRRWADIDSLLFHQMATVFGGDKRKRIPRVAINGAVTVDGDALRIHDPLTWVWHAQGYSQRSIGIEVEGWYAGVEGDDSTFWRPKSRPGRQPMSLPDGVVCAALSLSRYYIRLVAAHGGEVRHILTHRQAYPTKPSDPGEAIYRAVCAPLMQEFGLDGADQYRAAYRYRKGAKWVNVKPGRPVPSEWLEGQPTSYRDQPDSGGTDKWGNPA